MLNSVVCESVCASSLIHILEKSLTLLRLSDDLDNNTFLTTGEMCSSIYFTMPHNGSLCKYHSAQTYIHWCSLHLIKRLQILRSVFQNIEFEVITAMVTKSSIFWDTMSCRASKFNRRFAGICRLILLGRRISQARNQYVYLPISGSLFFA
jgi:hypothetical protein